jgi:hypothetical protein
MATQNILPSSDLVTTSWSTTGSSFHGTLAANSGAGDGTHYCDTTVSGTANLKMGTTFSTSGIASISAVSWTTAWESSSKSTASAFIQIWNSAGTILLAQSSGNLTTGSSSEVTSGPTALSLQSGGMTLSNWPNCQIWLNSALSGDSTGNFFGLLVTVTYTASGAPPTPTGLTVASDATNPTTVLDVSWNSSSGATSYNLLQASTVGGTYSTVQTGISGTSTTVTGLTPGTEYAFQVEAVGSGGTSSPSSGVAWATEPGLPTSLGSPSASATAINVSFTFPSIGSNLSQTCEYRYETPVGAGNWVSGNIGNGSTPIPGLSPLTQYGIEIASVIQSTNSDWSGTIQGAWTSEITVITPPMPANFTGPFGQAVRQGSTW